MGLNYLQSPDINPQFFWPIMTLIICVQTYKKFGLEAKIGVGTFVCLIYIQNVNVSTGHCLLLLLIHLGTYYVCIIESSQSDLLFLSAIDY